MAKSPETSSKSKPPAARKAPAAAPASAPAAAAEPSARVTRLGAAPRGIDYDPAEPPPIGVIVFVHVITEGRMGGLTHAPLHEVPLMRAKLEALGSGCRIEASWPKDRPRERGISSSYLAEEYARLRARYTFTDNTGAKRDVLGDIYGPAHTGRLLAIIKRMHHAYVAAVGKADGDELREEQFEDIAKLALPDSDFIDLDTAAK